MSTIISSPGVQINEIDLTVNARQTTGLTVAVIGYANEGPVNEPTYISSVSELEDIFGAPTNAAERYMYHSARQVLTRSLSQVLAVRMPYDTATAVDTRNVLAYPVSANNIEDLWGVNGDAVYSTPREMLDAATEINILQPVSFLLTEEQYNTEIQQGTFNWNRTVNMPTHGGSNGQIRVCPDAADLVDTGIFGERLNYTINTTLQTMEIEISPSLAAINNTYFITTKDIEDPVTNVISSGDYLGNQTKMHRVQSVIPGVGGANDRIVIKIPSRETKVGTIDIPATGYITIAKQAPGQWIQPNFPVGMFIADNNQGIQTNIFEGTYVGIIDNSNIDSDTGYTSLSSIKALNGVKDSDDNTVGLDPIKVNSNSQPSVEWGIDSLGTPITDIQHDYDHYTSWSVIPSTRIDFKLTSSSTTGSTVVNVTNSVSEVLEKTPYPIHGSEYQDTIILGFIKLRRSAYSPGADVLVNSYAGSYVGSLYSLRKQNTSSGGAAQSAFIEDVVSGATDEVKVIVSPYVSSSTNWFTANSEAPNKKIRVHGSAKSLYSIGTYSVLDTTSQKLIGNLPEKLDRALKLIDDSLTYPIDLIIDAGLSTIWPTVYNKYYDFTESGGVVGTAFKQVANFSDEDGFPADYFTAISTKVANTSAYPGSSERLLQPFRAIQQYFTSFAGDSRKDVMYIADPLKQLFIRGRDYKIEDKMNFNFSSEIYWPLYHLFEPIRSSFVASYANWAKINDSFTAKSIWAPMSGVVAGVVMSVEQNAYPWTTVAGFSRGSVTGLVDIALSPSQRNRDLLYKISMNPVANFASDGVVIFGQKTLFTKPSAFDRINVRRMFIALEKYTARSVKYFVFEPNTYFTRSRLVSTLQPLFESAKQNEGLYDYRIICDERNNTADVIDNNELRVDIYIKPTRTAEFVLVNFFATRTSQSFDEILPL